MAADVKGYVLSSVAVGVDVCDGNGNGAIAPVVGMLCAICRRDIARCSGRYRAAMGKWEWKQEGLEQG